MEQRIVRRFVGKLDRSAVEIDTANKLMDHVRDPAFRQMNPIEEVRDMAMQAVELRRDASEILRSASRLKGIGSIAKRVRQYAGAQITRSYADERYALQLATVSRDPRRRA